MRFSARLLFAVLCTLVTFCSMVTPVAAQTITPTYSPQQTTTSYDQFRTPNVDNTVPRNNHAYTQAVMIDVLSAVVCQMTGIDPTNPTMSCLGVNPQTGQIGMIPSQDQMSQSANGQPQAGGALGLASNLIGGTYVQSVSSVQYYHYLADNFGIVKPALAANPPAAATDCSNNKFGYGFCGLTPIFSLWKSLRDASYGFLTLIFIALGVGVMLRFKVDPRTVMTLQNQIPRVIVAIILITFSYAIAGAMIDLMWTVTYAGISIISNAAPQSRIALDCSAAANQPPTNGAQPAPVVVNGQTQPANTASSSAISSAGQLLINQPISFANKIFLRDCNGNVSSGLVNIAARVSDSVRGLVTSIIDNLMGWNTSNLNCGVITGKIGDCFIQFGLWITQLIVIAIIIGAMLIALFRLWFELIKTYITILIFVIMAPIWIIFGLIPGRPLGFEKWLRIMFANLAAYPLVAFILVFGRVMIDSVPANPNPGAVFIPPLIGNPNVASFSVFIGFGAIMLAPTIPGMIKERMKAKGSGNYGKTVAAGLGFAAGMATSPGKKAWESLNHKNASTGAPEGALAVMKQKAWQRAPLVGRRSIAKKQALHEAHATGDYRNLGSKTRAKMGGVKTAQEDYKYDQRQSKIQSLREPGKFRKTFTTESGRQAKIERLEQKQGQSQTPVRRAEAENQERTGRETAERTQAERIADAIRKGQGNNNGNGDNSGGKNT